MILYLVFFLKYPFFSFFVAVSFLHILLLIVYDNQRDRCELRMFFSFFFKKKLHFVKEAEASKSISNQRNKK
ncbi:hypothetical protein BY996DRAFT_4621274 [Phakopsora pachyrhizi]|nr:hypothetical protein BY996DRAFT_4621274 [Phakopsora pachyrhizi]